MVSIPVSIHYLGFMKPIPLIGLLLAFQLLHVPPASCQEKSIKDKSFTLALCQMNVVGGDRPANLAHAGEMIARAAKEGAQFVLLPEAMDLGWTDPSALSEAEPIPGGSSFSYLADKARKHSVYICSGLIEKAGDKVFNSAVIKVIFSPSSVKKHTIRDTSSLFVHFRRICNTTK